MMIVILWTVKDRGANVDDQTGALVTETLPEYDGGRQVTVYFHLQPPAAVVFAADGQGDSRGGGRFLEASALPPTMIVGVHGLSNEMSRLNEYSPVFDADRFVAHEEFFVNDVRYWVSSRFELTLTPGTHAVFGYSAGGQLALALGIRHPDVYGTVMRGSPGGGYKPSGQSCPSRFRGSTYLVAPLNRSSLRTRPVGQMLCAKRALTS